MNEGIFNAKTELEKKSKYTKSVYETIIFKMPRNILQLREQRLYYCFWQLMLCRHQWTYK